MKGITLVVTKRINNMKTFKEIDHHLACLTRTKPEYDYFSYTPDVNDFVIMRIPDGSAISRDTGNFLVTSITASIEEHEENCEVTVYDKDGMVYVGNVDDGINFEKAIFVIQNRD